MGTIRGLSHPTIVEHNGLLYLTGYREGAIYFRRSADRGRTWMRFADGSEERQICAGAEEGRAGLVKLESQGRRLLAAVTISEGIAIYVSADDGETWQREGIV